MSVPLYLVDAFTDRPFAGNPAAVCLPAADRDAAWMQAAAAEMNQAETAFLRPRPDGDWDLRWFTPTVEVELCGHATLASAHVLWETGRVAAATPIRFHTQSGVLTCTKRGDRVEMDFPAEPATAVQSPAEEAFALGATPTFVGRNRMDMLVVLGSAEEVRRLAPDLSQVAQIKARGVIVTAPADAAGIRLRVPVLRPADRGARGPGDGLGPLLPGPVLARRTGEGRAGRPSGVEAGRDGGGAGGRGPGDSSAGPPCWWWKAD